jgi:GntR family transcriptional regulator, arabinose operon transcriptional repressor
MSISRLKHESIREYVLGAIRAGRLRIGDKAPSEYALAKRFDVNKTTCNKAISTLVAEGYLERRKGAGTFIVNPKAKGVPAIGIYMNLRPGSYFSQLLIAIQEEAYARGYGLFFFQSLSFESLHQFEELQQHILASGVRGMIINRPYQKEFPSIYNLYVDTSVPDEKANQIQIDHFKGGYLLAKHFMEYGHTQVAFISQDITREDLMSRAYGFQMAFEEKGLGESAKRFHAFSKSKHNLMPTIQKLLRSDHRITGIGFDSIHVATEAITLLRRFKIRVPEDISVAAFGNAGAGDQSIPITTIDQHPTVLGHTAADTLIDQIEGRLKSPVRIVTDVELVKGETVMRLPEHRKREAKRG